jgi:hypothetical protein
MEFDLRIRVGRHTIRSNAGLEEKQLPGGFGRAEGEGRPAVLCAVQVEYIRYCSPLGSGVVRWVG